jgi:hypothetical protein
VLALASGLGILVSLMVSAPKAHAYLPHLIRIHANSVSELELFHLKIPLSKNRFNIQVALPQFLPL